MKRRWAPWLIGILAASLLFAALLTFTDFHYSGSDDTPILRAFMGYEGGEPASFHLYAHTVLAGLLWALAKLAPGVAWYSILQLFLLWLSCAVMVKSLVQIGARSRAGWLTGAVGGLLLCGAIGLYVCCRVSYTTTAALCGAAAVAQLMSVDPDAKPRAQLWRGLGSAALLLAAYCLRQISVLPPLAFWLGALLWRLLTQKSRRPLVLLLVWTMAALAVFAGGRELELSLRGQRDWLDWQNARIDLFDYTHYDTDTSAEALAQVGWTDAEFRLIKAWYFMDDNITAEAFRTLLAAQPGGQPSVSAAVQTVKGYFAGDSPMRLTAIALMLLALWCVLVQALRGEKSPWGYLAPVCGVLLCAAMLCYLGYRGRLPMRAAASALFPAAAFLAALAMELLAPGTRRWTNAAALIGACACAALLCVSIARTVPTLYIDPDAEEMNTAADLDRYALENPDKLIIYDLSLVSDDRLFPDASEGIPGNVMFWGGYPARSPSWYAMLDKYGVTELGPQLFLRENVLVASTDPEPWQSLVEYVAENTDADVEWDFYDTSGYVNVFQLYEW